MSWAEQDRNRRGVRGSGGAADLPSGQFHHAPPPRRVAHVRERHDPDAMGATNARDQRSLFSGVTAQVARRPGGPAAFAFSTCRVLDSVDPQRLRPRPRCPAAECANPQFAAPGRGRAGPGRCSRRRRRPPSAGRHFGAVRCAAVPPPTSAAKRPTGGVTKPRSRARSRRQAPIGPQPAGSLPRGRPPTRLSRRHASHQALRRGTRPAAVASAQLIDPQGPFRGYKDRNTSTRTAQDCHGSARLSWENVKDER